MEGNYNSDKKYRIVIKEKLNESWSKWFEGMEMSFETTEKDGDITVLMGTLADQAALNGLLNKIWGLNLTVLSVENQ